MLIIYLTLKVHATGKYDDDDVMMIHNLINKIQMQRWSYYEVIIHFQHLYYFIKSYTQNSSACV